MKIVQTEILSLEQKQQLFQLWNSEYPEKICYTEMKEFENYLEGLFDIKNYLIVEAKPILGWAFTFVREQENWFGIIVNSKYKRNGFGTLLLNEVKKQVEIFNGWVTDHQKDFKRNGEYYESPIPFYVKNEFKVNNEIRIENEKISAVKITWKV